MQNTAYGEDVSTWESFRAITLAARGLSFSRASSPKQLPAPIRASSLPFPARDTSVISHAGAGKLIKFSAVHRGLSNHAP